MSYMKVVTAKMDSDQVMKADGLARKLGVTRSDVIREAVKYMIEQQIPPSQTSAERYEIIVTFKISSDLLTELDRVTYKYRLYRSDIIRYAVNVYYKHVIEEQQPLRAKVKSIRL